MTERIDLAAIEEWENERGRSAMPAETVRALLAEVRRLEGEVERYRAALERIEMRGKTRVESVIAREALRPRP